MPGRRFAKLALLLAFASFISHLHPSMPSMLPPRYLRSAKLVNSTDKEVEVTSKFESGEEEKNQLAAGASKDVEKEIDKGGWTACDPIKQLLIKSGSDEHSVEVECGGVEIHQYTISYEGGTLMATKVKM